MERASPRAKNQIPKITEENPRPGLKLHQKARNRDRLRAWGGWLHVDLSHGSGHLNYVSCVRAFQGSREDMPKGSSNEVTSAQRAA
jgi:hypothetical protein